MNRTPISKSISRSEMLTLRESGMSNAQIADATGISKKSVLKYIGKEPAEITRATISAGWKLHQEQKRAAEVAPRSIIEAPSKSEAEIVQGSQVEMAKVDAENVKADAVRNATPIIKSAKIAKEAASSRHRLVARSKPAVAKKAKPAVKPALQVSDHIVHLKSEHASYQFNAAAKTVQVSIGDAASFDISVPMIPAILSDLEAIYKNANSQKYSCKTW